jgi:ARC6-like, IMS domain/DnaJ domain
VRIPLDYYQILGIPESDLSELEQAYQDRLLQLPQQEYSDAAIESRNRLITAAYQVLKDPQQREEYVATQIASVLIEGEDPSGDRRIGNFLPDLLHRRPELDIATEHFLGGLLILFELGEYEEITSICMPYLGNNGRSSNSGSLHRQPRISLTLSGSLHQGSIDHAVPLANLKHTVDGPQIVPLKPDLILAMVSSFWELGEREWRDGCYEEAVIHYETAKTILVQEDLFPQIQGEVDRRLDRLRPYRISSLVSLPLDRHEQRRQGIQFLEELLESACTNEIKCQERFALNSESTIPFIHETLPHLTAAEQRNLFSQLARDSHQLGSKALNVMQLACTYLHVHASIAQGFAYRNPQSIYTAQQILQYRLSQRIDVTIEQSICALLLGQTEEANQILATATESAALVVIRQQSQGLPNLLRGLCWYVESWLKDEAFPCFRDLVTSDPSIHAYFNDRDVQDFADRLPTTDTSVTSWATSSPQLIDVPPSGDLSGAGNLCQLDLFSENLHQSDLFSENLHQSDLFSGNSPQSDLHYAETESVKATLSSRSRPSSLHPLPQTPADRLGEGNIIPAIRVEQTPPSPEPTLIEQQDDNNVIQLENERQRRRSMPIARTIDGQFDQTDVLDRPQPTVILETSSQLIPASKSGQLTKSNTGTSALVRPRRTRRSPNIPRILLVGTGGVTCLWGAIWLANKGIQALTHPDPITVTTTSSPSAPVTTNPNLAQPSPKPTPKPALAGSLTTDIAQQTVQKWLSIKTKSLNKEYEIAQLKDILVGPALTKTIDRVQTTKKDGVHWQYSHRNIGIQSISHSSPLANVATIQVRVEENAKYYQGDRLNPDESYSKQLLVEYNLIRQKDNWYIKDMSVIK